MNYRGHSAGLSPFIRVVVPWLAVLLAGLSLIAPSLARATPFAHTIAFTASGFDFGAPQDPVSGTITLTYDPLVTFSENAPIDALDLVIAGQIFTPVGALFFYNHGLTGSSLYITDLPTTGPFPGTNVFDLFLNLDSSGRPVCCGFFRYAVAASDRPWGASTTFVFVPEPATLLLALAALVSCAAGYKRRIHYLS